uniref:Uncharacterized protein n=1 Tax=Anguilla anguilla TaxID=7936 RepID=A0A0E9V363_ANGAN
MELWGPDCRTDLIYTAGHELGDTGEREKERERN